MKKVTPELEKNFISVKLPRLKNPTIDEQNLSDITFFPDTITCNNHWQQQSFSGR
jgi:hypothetical protein